MRIPKKLFRAIRKIPTVGEKDEFKQDRNLRPVSKIPISETPGELAEMDFVDYAGQETPHRVKDTFTRCTIISFTDDKRRKNERPIKRPMRPLRNG